LQAADICANNVKQIFDKSIATGVVPPLAELQDNIYRVGYWDEAHMVKVLDAQPELSPTRDSHVTTSL
jgi:hypothetical protein